MTKFCSKCKLEKPLSEFPKDNSRKDGYKCHCKVCRYELNKINKAKQPEVKKLERNRVAKLWRENNPTYQKEYYLKNKESIDSRIKSNYYKNPSKKAHERILRIYGLTLQEYNTLTEKFPVCAICSKKCEVRNRLCIDHDHVTGKVRGLLCFKCNSGLGYFRDNITYLNNAIEYLKGKL